MRSRSSRMRTAAIAGIAAAGIALAGAASAQAHDRGGRGPGQEGRPILSEAVVTLPDGSYATVRSITGTVSAVSATSITVKAANGTARTFAVNADTAVKEDRAASSIGSIAVGDTVHVHGTVSGDTATATRIHAGDPGPAGGHGGRGDHRGRGVMPGAAPGR